MARRIDSRCCARLLLVIVLVLNAGFCKAASVANSKPFMLEKINHCAAVNFVKNSTYFLECRSVVYPEVYLPPEAFASVSKCMILYDITNRICSYQGVVVKSLRLTLPESADEFDATLKRLEETKLPRTSSDDTIKSLCKSIKDLFTKLNNINVEPANDVVRYEEEYVTKILLNDSECPFACHSPQQVNKFCMVLFWVNEVFGVIPPVTKVQDNKVEKLPVVINSTATTNAVVTVQTAQEAAIASDKSRTSKPVEIPKPKVEKKNEQIAANEKPDGSKRDNEVAVKDSQVKPVTTATQANQNKADNIENIGIVNNDKNLPKQIPEPAADIEHQQNPPSSNDRPEPKTQDNIENPIQPDDRNPDTFASEEEQNKKNNDEAYDQGGPDIMDDVNALPQDGRKFNTAVGNEEAESHFFAYFSLISMCCLGLYVGYHNKQKILAMVLEGRRGRRGRGSRRRPSTASYRKLDSNLEEAVTSQCNSNVTHVIY